jgi:hypothetical protein
MDTSCSKSGSSKIAMDKPLVFFNIVVRGVGFEPLVYHFLPQPWMNSLVEKIVCKIIKGLLRSA